MKNMAGNHIDQRMTAGEGLKASAFASRTERRSQVHSGTALPPEN